MFPGVLGRSVVEMDGLTEGRVFEYTEDSRISSPMADGRPLYVDARATDARRVCGAGLGCHKMMEISIFWFECSQLLG